MEDENVYSFISSPHHTLANSINSIVKWLILLLLVNNILQPRPVTRDSSGGGIKLMGVSIPTLFRTVLFSIMASFVVVVQTRKKAIVGFI